ncbi:MAG: hypothetical protein JOZ39_08080, partial [Chloroflexi bacterium]|nr:hypothetical protein [Chloroflexota bacterium]
MYSGYPFQADIQMAVLYPISLLNEWIGRAGFSFVALEWEAVIHYGLAATFTYLVAELLTGSRWAGLLAGVTFAFSGFLTSYPSQSLPVLETTVWLPLLLYFLERGARSRRPVAWLMLAGSTLAVAVMAGHPQTILYEVYLAGAYFLVRYPWPRWWLAVWAALPAIGLSAAQWLPSAQLFAFNSKGRLDYSFAAGGLTAADLPGLLLDAPSGGRILYLGLVPLALAIVGALLVRGRQTVFWSVTVILALLLGLGTHGPLFRLAFLVAPGWNLFRDQERVVVLLALSGAVLAAYGLVAVRDWLLALKARLTAPGWLPQAACAVLALAAFANLWWANAGNNLSADPPPGWSSLSEFLRPVTADPDIFRVRLSDASLEHNAGNLLGLQVVTGDSPFELRTFKDWTEDQPDGNRVTEWQLLRLTNSHYVVSSKDLCGGASCQDSDGVQLLASRDFGPESALFETQAPATLRLYRVAFPLPRSLLVGGGSMVASEREAIQMLNRPGF